MCIFLVYILCVHCRLLFKDLEIGCNCQTFLDSVFQKVMLGLDIMGSGTAEFLSPSFGAEPNSCVSNTDSKPASVVGSLNNKI